MGILLLFGIQPCAATRNAAHHRGIPGRKRMSAWYEFDESYDNNNDDDDDDDGSSSNSSSSDSNSSNTTNNKRPPPDQFQGHDAKRLHSGNPRNTEEHHACDDYDYVESSL